MGPSTYYISINNRSLYKVSVGGTTAEAINEAIRLFDKDRKEVHDEYILASEKDKEAYDLNYMFEEINKIEVFTCKND